MGLFDSLKNKAMMKMAEKFAASAAGKEMLEGKGLEELMKDPQLAQMADRMKQSPDLSSLTPEQVKKMLEHPLVQKMAAQWGLSADDLAAQVSSSLPEIMKHLQSKK